MDGKMSPARQRAASGRARLAGSGTDPVPGRHGHPPAGAVRVPPFTARQGHGMTGRWPLQSFLELGALPGAVPCARLHARQVLWEWQLTALSDSTELLLSELVTNAVQVSRTMTQATAVRLWLLSDRTQVVVLVWDASPQPPVRMEISDEAEAGRGLLLVEAISARWGWHFPQDTGGKVVWAQTLLE
jgi:anti-sigma regulatory factor (Ser/Thr protein kinase)